MDIDILMKVLKSHKHKTTMAMRCLFQKPGDHPIRQKKSWSEKASLGALGEFQGILEATLGIQKVILGMRHCTLRMASCDLSNTKTTILEATPRAIPPKSKGSLHEEPLNANGDFQEEERRTAQ